MKKNLYYLIFSLFVIIGCKKNELNLLSPEEIHTKEIIEAYKNYFPGISRYPKVYKADGLGLDTRVVVGIDGQEMFLGLAEKFDVLVKGTFDISQYIDSTYSFHKVEMQTKGLGVFILHFKKMDGISGQGDLYKTLMVNSLSISSYESALYPLQNVITGDKLQNLEYLYKTENIVSFVHNAQIWSYNPLGDYKSKVEFFGNSDPQIYLEAAPFVAKTVNLSGDGHTKHKLSDAVNSNIITLALKSKNEQILWSKDYAVSDWILQDGENRYNASFIYDNHNSISIVTRESGKRFIDGQLRDYKKNTVLYINKVTGQIYNTLLF
ncbi:hypothetical protein [Sphingobacterium alimentarium]|nr:hypothetical protein [Sphingobacterium alimentarium]